MFFLFFLPGSLNKQSGDGDMIDYIVMVWKHGNNKL